MATPPTQFITNIDKILLESIEENSELMVIDEIVCGDNYVNINVQNLILETPLHIATRKNNIKIVEYLLLNKNTRPNIQNVYGDTALHIAIRNGFIEIARKLLQDWRMTHWIMNKNKESVLHMVLSKNIPDLYYLVKKQFVNSKDILGYTPFMYAILKYIETKNVAYEKIICDLLDNGALVEIPDILDDIEDTWKSFINHPKFPIYTEIKENITLLGYSCERGNLELLTYLCDNFISSLTELIDYEKYIMLCIRGQHIDCCIKLLTLDIVHNKTPILGLTKQLFFANVFDEDQLIRILLVLLDTNRTSVTEIIKYCMVYMKPDVFKRFINLETIDSLCINLEPMIVVCCILFPELFTFMIDHFKIRNNIVDKYGNTLITIAAQQSTVYNSQVLRKLIKLGYDPNIPNRQGKKAIDYAIVYRNIEMIRILLPLTKLTLDECFLMISKYSIIPSNVLFPILNINWLEAIKVMKVGTFQKLLDLIDDSGENNKRELLSYMIGKENGYDKYLEVLVELKKISIENSHNTIDIWSLETIENDNQNSIIQYGKGINGKYKTLTLGSIVELVRQTEDYVSLGYIKDPFDRSSLQEQYSYPNNYPFFIEVLIRKLLD